MWAGNWGKENLGHEQEKANCANTFKKGNANLEKNANLFITGRPIS
jgi:hypothetical protein